jgi:glycosyltransferase involved in cell wall biosynthesis
MKISAIMIVGSEQGFSNMPEIAIQCFQNQTFKDCELVIINHGDKSYSGDRIREVKIQKTPDMHVGAMRNLAFEIAKGDFLMTWDSDDWRHPDSIEYQANLTPDGRMSILKNRIHLDHLTGNAFIHDTIVGGGASMLYPSDTPNRYRNWLNNSDGWFRCMFIDKVLLDNPPELYIYNCHGKNLSPNHWICGKSPGDKDLEEFQQVLVEKVKRLYKPSYSTDK